MRNVSSDQKTADHLKILILDVIKEVKGKWKATIIAITSDASGESRAARKRIIAEFPWFVAPDCFAHQINLVVGDYYKVPSTSQFLQYTKKATDLIAWLRSKTMVLAMLRDVQKALNLANPSRTKRVLSVIHAVLT
ncbi:hypothetical protein EDB19DRAFT_1834081 [Suillus lakei]|nr:hypothetical protein EDB19DRAFT_1834081 [Suillus lakei]